MADSGTFITFEGGEGCGKSTQLAMAADRLRAGGADVLCIREPGGTVVGEAVRGLLLDPSHDSLHPVTELLLYEASRAQLVNEVIAPALDAGTIVLCDRFADSTTAYQGYGRGLDPTVVESLNTLATAGLVPALTIVLDLDVREGLRRATAATTDRLEGLDQDFHERVRTGFLSIAAADPGRVTVVDGNGNPEAVALRVLEALRAVPELARHLD